MKDKFPIKYSHDIFRVGESDQAVETFLSTLAADNAHEVNRKMTRVEEEIIKWEGVDFLKKFHWEIGNSNIEHTSTGELRISTIARLVPNE